MTKKGEAKNQGKPTGKSMLLQFCKFQRMVFVQLAQKYISNPMMTHICLTI